MAETITLYEPGVESEEPITAELTDGYGVLLDDVSEKVDSDPEELLCRSVESLLHQSIQTNKNGDGEMHSTYANLVYELEDKNEIDIQSVVENAIHTLNQQI